MAAWGGARLHRGCMAACGVLVAVLLGAWLHAGCWWLCCWVHIVGHRSWCCWAQELVLVAQELVLVAQELMLMAQELVLVAQELVLLGTGVGAGGCAVIAPGIGSGVVGVSLALGLISCSWRTTHCTLSTYSGSVAWARFEEPDRVTWARLISACNGSRGSSR